MYRESLGDDFARMQVIDTEALHGETDERDAKREAWERVFGGLIPEPDLAATVAALEIAPEEASGALEEAVASYRSGCAESKALDERIGSLRSRVQCAEAALRLAEDKIKPSAEPLSEWKKGGAAEARDAARSELEEACREHGASTLDVLGRRFAAVRTLTLSGGGARERFEHHLQDLIELEATSASVRQVQETLMRLNASWPSWNVSTREKAVAKQVEAGRQDLLTGLRRVASAAVALRGASVHGAQAKPFRDHLVGPIDPESTFGDLYEQCDRLLSLWYERNYWNWCELAAIADTVERENRPSRTAAA